jgi:hypothetical protein
MGVRTILTKVSARWRALQEIQRTAWVAAAKEAKSNNRLGQSGALSGFLLFTKINCMLAQFGQEQVDAPPARPQFPDLAPASLVITNTAGVIALKLACPTQGQFMKRKGRGGDGLVPGSWRVVGRGAGDEPSPPLS